MGLVVAILRLYNIIKGYFLEMVLNAWEWIRSLILDELIPWFVEAMPDGLQAFFERIDLQQISDLLADVTWIIPFWAALAILSTAYGICAGIRLLRWVLAFIPTIGG